QHVENRFGAGGSPLHARSWRHRDRLIAYQHTPARIETLFDAVEGVLIEHSAGGKFAQLPPSAAQPDQLCAPRTSRIQAALGAGRIVRRQDTLTSRAPLPPSGAQARFALLHGWGAGHAAEDGRGNQPEPVPRQGEQDKYQTDGKEAEDEFHDPRTPKRR